MCRNILVVSCLLYFEFPPLMLFYQVDPVSLHSPTHASKGCLQSAFQESARDGSRCLWSRTSSLCWCCSLSLPCPFLSILGCLWHSLVRGEPQQPRSLNLQKMRNERDRLPHFRDWLRDLSSSGGSGGWIRMKLLLNYTDTCSINLWNALLREIAE